MIALLRQLLATILSLSLAIPVFSDPVGNRTQKVSALPGYPGGLTNYNANDQLSTDTYDANGNTTASSNIGYVYDFENHLISANGITYVYDGDGHRISKTVNGVTISFATTDINPTGYSQVVGETYPNLGGNSEYQHSYIYGLDAVLELRQHYVNSNNTTQQMYFVHDGHGSVRAITDQNGAVTDTYDYDAFGVLIHQTGTTPNTTLYSGEQFDPDLNLYYNRARYLNTSTDRFLSMDSFEGDIESPLSLHKYLYGVADAVNRIDPSGNDSLDELMTAAALSVTVTTLSNILVTGIFFGSTGANPSFDGAIVSFHGSLNGNGWSAEGGVDFLWQKSTNSWFYSASLGGGTNPLGTLPTSRAGRGLGYSVSIGPIFNMSDPQQMSGASLSAVYPMSILHLIQGAMFTPNKAWGALAELAKHVKNTGVSDMTAAFGFSSSGPTFAQFGLRSNAFGTFGYYGSKFYPLSGSGFENMINDVSGALQNVFSVIQNGAFASSSAMASNADSIVQSVRTASNQ